MLRDTTDPFTGVRAPTMEDRSPVGCGHGRGVVVAAHRSRRLVEDLARRAALAAGGTRPGTDPAAEEEGDELQEEGECPFGPFHGDSFQGVW